ncbi:hypothetical protein IWW48_004678 [Coemansia sp. RSA 1200]|nr:hypothetical protein IWW48_004678 [Coemansia sp. RSA 1200]
MNDTASGALVPALAAALALLETQQQQIITRLRHIHTQLSQEGKGEQEELLTTLTHYINQANGTQRRMVLIHRRMKDLKRRSERLREHHAKHNQDMANWMKQEQTRKVPEAVVALAPKSQMIFGPSVAAEKSGQGMSSSLPASLVLDKVRMSAPPRSACSSPPPSQPAVLPNGLLERSGSSVDGNKDDSSNLTGTSVPMPAHSLQPQSGRPSSPSPSVASTVDSVVRPSDSMPIAMVKRKGKRRVRVPTIE